MTLGPLGTGVVLPPSAELQCSNTDCLSKSGAPLWLSPGGFGWSGCGSSALHHSPRADELQPSAQLHPPPETPAVTVSENGTSIVWITEVYLGV